MIRSGSSREYGRSNDCVAVKQKADVRNRNVMMRLRFGDTAFSNSIPQPSEMLSSSQRSLEDVRWDHGDVVPVGLAPQSMLWFSCEPV